MIFESLKNNNGKFQTWVQSSKKIFPQNMFSYVVLSPEAEYAKKSNQQETRFGAREPKRSENGYVHGRPIF